MYFDVHIFGRNGRLVRKSTLKSLTKGFTGVVVVNKIALSVRHISQIFNILVRFWTECDGDDPNPRFENGGENIENVVIAGRILSIRYQENDPTRAAFRQHLEG